MGKNKKYYDLDSIMKMAEEKGVNKNALFLQTLKNYETLQLAIAKIDEIIKSDDVMVSKEYVKGRENIYLNPGIKELAKLVEASNKTLDKLLLIIENNRIKEADSLLEWVNNN